MGMVDSQPHSINNRASVDSTSDEKEEDNWFPLAEATLKRTLIQKLISVFLKNLPPEVSPAARSGEGSPLLISQLLPSTSLHFFSFPL